MTYIRRDGRLLRKPVKPAGGGERAWKLVDRGLEANNKPQSVPDDTISRDGTTIDRDQVISPREYEDAVIDINTEAGRIARANQDEDRERPRNFLNWLED